MKYNPEMGQYHFVNCKLINSNYIFTYSNHYLQYLFREVYIPNRIIIEKIHSEYKK